MNKLYLLALLGLTVKAQIDGAEPSDGWYAGDCLDDTDFSDSYGWVDFDCGDECGVTDGDNGTDGGDGGDGDDEKDEYYYEELYPECFDETFTMEQEWYCTAFAITCDLYSEEDDTCYDSIVACADDTDCMIAVVCSEDADCISEVEAAVATWESENDWSSDDTEDSRKIRKLKTPKTLDEYEITSGIYLYGLDTLSTSWPVYCDHYHLYSFGYQSVTPQGDSDTSDELTVSGWSMIGFPGLCSYSDGLGISSEFEADTTIATTGDQFAWTCGYYVEYEWAGDDDVYFEIVTMNAVAKAFSAIALATMGSLLF